LSSFESMINYFYQTLNPISFKSLDNYNYILAKIQVFIRKFYYNELLKGTILFLTIGLLYLIFTLFIEYFLWLKPFYRTLLFWLFITIEIALLVRFILFPIFKLLGIKKGITLTDAAKLIGIHFPEIDDKLLNTIQLHDTNQVSELFLVSIDQKASNLKPFSFQNAIDFKYNKKYIKYLMIPVTIWLLFYLSGNNIFTSSYHRLVHHRTEFIPPSPFAFELKNTQLSVLEGGNILLQVSINGKTIPEEAYIVLDDQKYFLQKQDQNSYTYQLNDLNKNTQFHFEANEVISNDYEILVIPVPQIQSIKLFLHYPSHLKKPDEIIENTGNATIPEGSQITWDIKTLHTSEVTMRDSINRYAFSYHESTQNYLLKRVILDNYQYSITSSNIQLKDYENLPFSITVLKDVFPEIHIETDIDSLKFGEAHFVGRLSDDYGIQKLQVVYYPIQKPDQISIKIIPITPSTITDFYFLFPSNLNLTEGTDYEFYFQVFDNDVVNRFKSTKSKTYSYFKDSELQLQDKILLQQEKNIDDIDKLLHKQEKNQQEIDAFQKQMQNKSDIKFNEKQKVQQLLLRQQQYEEMMQRKTENLKENLEKQNETTNPYLNEKKEEIQKRIDEFKQSEEQKKLLEELQKLSDKLKKEDLLDKIQKLSANNKQKEKSLEQLLELTKRFYVEQKAQQISEKLADLALKQEKLKESDTNTKTNQDKLNEEFKKIQEDLKEMNQQNMELKEPMKLDEQKPEQEAVKQDMEQASKQLDANQKQNAQKKQQAAANIMKQMSKNMQSMLMEMEGDTIDEDIASLRRIIENLITFSYQQENLLNDLSKESQSVTNLSTNLRKQNTLKTYFEQIDDSLFTLAMRQAKLSSRINEYVANAKYYLAESNESLSENQISKTRSNQQFVMTAANDLAAMLASLLDNLQNLPPAMGQGKGKGSGQSFSLPDIIQKQGELKEKMQSKIQNGQQQGDQQGENQGKKGEEKGKHGENGKQGQQGNQGNNTNGEQQSKELFEIYKQQSMLREALEKQLENLKGAGLEIQTNNVLKQMENLEKMLLEKGITKEVLSKIMSMEHELLKLKNAAYEQGMEEKRISNTNKEVFNAPAPKYLEEFYKKLNQLELLNREPLPFQPQINQKVNRYFQK